MADPIDPGSPVPLYHQIAEQLRDRIARGELQPGEALEPLRRAALQWGVNLHTVRHAYTALAREGLVEMRTARGTRVTEAAARRARDPAEGEGAGAFVQRVLREARARYGWSAPALAGKLREADPGEPGGRPAVAVVECSRWQCETHAAELRERWDVEAVPWPLALEDEPRAGAIVATFFHYNDIRRRWPHLLGQMHFVTIRPDAAVVGALSSGGAAVVVDRDEPTVQAIAADLSAVADPGLRVRTAVADHPADVLRGAARGERVLIAPRLWADLAEVWRRHPQVLELRYRYDPAELEDLATRLGWRPAIAADPPATPEPTP